MRKRSAVKEDGSAHGEGSVKTFSHQGCSGQSFKSVKTYVLGDLDISSNEGDELTNSFDLSSNTSKSIKSFQSIEEASNSPLKGNSMKNFKEDDEPQDGFNNACFIAQQSPFSFKNPIFYSCPNRKVNAKIDT